MTALVANFEDLMSFYFSGTTAENAWLELREHRERGDEAWLRRMLRHHRQSAIRLREELRFRAAADKLIVCVSVLEIAMTGGFIERDSPWTSFWEETHRILSEPFFRRYYEELYPDPLATRMRIRLEKTTEHDAEPDGTLQVLAFVALDRQFVANHERGVLLKLLDDYTVGGVRFKDLCAAIASPKDFLARVLTPPAERTVLDRAVDELGHFLAFCFALKQQLDSLSDRPQLHGAIALRYAYWFDIVGDNLQERLGEALELFLSWVHSASDTVFDRAAGDIGNYVLEARAILAELVGVSRRAYADAGVAP